MRVMRWGALGWGRLFWRWGLREGGVVDVGGGVRWVLGSGFGWQAGGVWGCLCGNGFAEGAAWRGAKAACIGAAGAGMEGGRIMPEAAL